MRIPVSWLAEHLELPEETTAEALAEAFVRIGLEVEEVTHLSSVRGPLVVGRVAEIEELTDFKKPIRYCQVEVGEDESGEKRTQEIICGATNFREGDLVVVALPGTVLPGGFEIAERKTYGRMSRGMICSAKELGIGEDHDGILVLPSGSADPGDDAVELVGLDDAVIELAITPDRGYCFSVRGLARELSNALEVPFGDPGSLPVPADDRPSRSVEIADPSACSRFVFRRVTGVDPTAPTPWWMRRRLALAGIRSISLAVDITNYVMLELGQPLHAWDATKLAGDIVVRRAKAGEKLTTLDDVERELDPDDVVICDDSGPVSLAGVMGGASTEIGSETHDVLLEAANWDPASIARMIRRHKLPSEAGKRFERSVDPAVAPVATELAAQLLVRYGEGTIAQGRTDVGEPKAPAPVTMPLALPDRIAGVNYERGVTARRLTQIGCRIEVSTSDEGVGLVTATPPSWRPDLAQPADLVEEVLRLEGYHTIPSVLPAAPPGRGLTPAQRRHRAVSRTLAHEGYVEVLPFPFTGPEVLDGLGIGADDPRRRTLSLLNALESDRSELSTTVLTGLIDALKRNVARGRRDLALFHVGQVVQPAAEQPAVPRVGVSQRPSDAEIEALHASLPAQPTHVGVVLAGQREHAGWWGKGREVSWADAVEAARRVAAAAGVELTISAGDLAPWHPGRCAELKVGDTVVGHAGELHPKVVEALGLPKRTCAMELDLDALPLTDDRPAPVVSAYPPVLLDIALVVDASVPSAELVDTVRKGAGELVEDVRLFDVYSGEQLESGKKSLAMALRFRAPDRTLKQDEATEARDAAVAAAEERFGATLRA
ncbi:phenylalanyl-tRNA synthetase beta subunit [Saccharopolyspora erythraea NRRL 2338]|uniref:Phenylalanine--tRNA ligase beta subunit n=1 Tax=Saccharopolyspora erythraea TaxID=1836 RepID=A0ABN1E659_SACER|nr:phenylalanine--tRNA ligase subunit beta [Saccharopolyspora erythraea]EQD82034.1 phenylalanyl-tRNA synthetase subunit beta [Saccharopolyspora erythraea D]PFG98152.1 phenylalanyl-tRNA synthetase beta subunit [Saccharopolyspora erythraea NRRL 2338]QRK88258.1 phenylalanine--tRNA ligase subunit beta [Saccharopolyspora erythraea]